MNKLENVNTGGKNRMTEEKLYQAYIHIEFISSKKHYDNLNDLMKILNENGFTVKEIHSAEDSELIRIKTGKPKHYKKRFSTI